MKVSSSAAQATRYRGIFPGRPEQVARVRHEVRRYLSGAGCPAAVTDDAVLAVSELSANAILHSRSRNDFFVVAVEMRSSYIYLQVEDRGGDWELKPRHGEHHHGLDLIEAFAGLGNWGVDTTAGGRVVWCRLELAR